MMSQKEPSTGGEDVKVIDSHLHVWASESESSRGNYPYAPNQTPPPALINKSSTSDLLRIMESAGVDGALIVQPINHKYDHRYVTDAIKAHPKKLKGMLLHDPTLSVDDAVSRLEELALMGFVGVRFNPYLWPAASNGGDGNAPMSEKGGSGLAVYKRCGELNLPVGVMCFKGLDLHYDDIVQLLETEPSTVMILDHIGFTSIGDNDDENTKKKKADNFQKLLSLAKYPNVNVKISALFRVAGSDSFPYDKVKKERFLPLLEAFGKDRLMFGTDFPYILEQDGGYDGAAKLVKQWCLECDDDGVSQAVLSGTVSRLFGAWS